MALGKLGIENVRGRSVDLRRNDETYEIRSNEEVQKSFGEPNINNSRNLS